MKNGSKIFCLILIAVLALCTTDAVAKPKQAKVYVFGVSINFTDSVTYITDVQTLDPAYIDTKTGFLYDRSIYSQQLQIWIEYNMKQPNTTCTIFFSKNKSKLESKYVKVRDKIRKDDTTVLKTIDTGKFKFIPQEWSEHERL